MALKAWLIYLCMERQLVDSVARVNLTHHSLLLLAVMFSLCSSSWRCCGGATAAQELLKGFKATPDPSVSSFQSLLRDSTGNYSLGFLRVEETHLALAVVHVRSSESLWTAKMTPLPRWTGGTELFFNGSLVVSDPRSGVFWSTYTDGDRVWLSNTSNLQIQKGVSFESVLWQSFDFPTNTLVENQNFTSAMSLVSSNGLYSMRLGSDFIGLYAKFGHGPDPGQLYWKHTALQAKAEIINGQGPIYAILKSDGYLGMYQNGSVPVDVESFNSYQVFVSGVRRLRLEQDGNLNGYFWTGSSWAPDYNAISDPCELPNACGSYGLCEPGKGCSCLDNATELTASGTCASPENQDSGDLCQAFQSKYKTLRRNGVELPFKELMGYVKMESFEECESACEVNCSCWGAVYSNSSGFCYTLEYPVGTLVRVMDESKMGFFKVREGAGKRKMRVGVWVGLGLLCGAILVVGGVGVGWYKCRKGKRGVGGYGEEEIGIGVGPYKHLGAESFRSIELSKR
ncbi:PREDICTED: PAN domain-containing protein At5g03700 [Ipomoea nil]|uniref:PAN domain-containing protein At5g03700 n=1 Tax=Ipomoea nil TaxID=35883 RepID=UPI000901ACBF|nr:PREDICTED: PAN domain-containing protein At5g03700 [Ipomoea nil]